MTNEGEPITRKERIDPKLRAVGWTIVPYDETKPLSSYQKCAIKEYPTENGPADYALCVDGEILGVVEGKKLSLSPQNVLTQAERYSKGVKNSPYHFGEFRVPFLYSTNGEVIWYYDIRDKLNRSRKISGFHTPDALRYLLSIDTNATLQRFFDIPDNPRMRPYQREACAAVGAAMAEKKQSMLVAMASGTGKTFTAVNLIYRLMKSGTAKRILFLVDRRALAAQAIRAFASFETEQGLKFDKTYEVYSQRFQQGDLEEGELLDINIMPESYLTNPKPEHAFVYVSTIQRMTINLFGHTSSFPSCDESPEEDARRLDIPIHAFDVIIADECHRGYTTAEVSVWRNTLDHFDAVKIGMTATPAAHTTAYFRDIIYRYEYERAVREGYLVDYDLVAIESDVRMNGIFLHGGEVIDIVDPETGVRKVDVLEDERVFASTEIEEKITSLDSNRRILKEIKTYADKHQDDYSRFPKILIFAEQDIPHISHADQLVDLARDVFGRGDSFVQKITGKVDRPLQHLREFRNRPSPGIAVTVDLLTTGIDIPDLEFIVFLRIVKSRILFEQMMGRGTRKGENISDKSHFVVFDCFGGSLHNYFKKVTGITAEPPIRQTKHISQVIEDIWNNDNRAYNIRVLIKRFNRIDKEMSGDARDLFSTFIENGDLKRLAVSLERMLQEDFIGTMELLRNRDFQNILVNYPRPPRTFIVDTTTQDAVTSKWVIRDLAGKEFKPEDYLSAFSLFVRENPDRIDAISILLNRPQEWGTDAISELKTKLAATPMRFTMENLQKAHEVQYHKALVDIVSMVKHAAREDEALFTAEERVTRAFERVTWGKTFTPDQQAWLKRIREHLIANLSLNEEDFETIPILTDHGGLRRADQIFDHRLPTLIQELNEAIAA